MTIVQSLIAGIIADILVARYDPYPSPARTIAFRTFAVAVPMAYTGVYLLATLGANGLWWDWNVSLGAWMWTGIAGFMLALIGLARRTPA